MVELTAEQIQQLAASCESPGRIVDPETNSVYVLVPAEEYDWVREILDDERDQRIIREIAQRDAIQRMLDEGE